MQGIRTLEHTATHCNTLQHTATHCNTHADRVFMHTLLFQPLSVRVCVCACVVQYVALWCFCFFVGGTFFCVLRLSFCIRVGVCAPGSATHDNGLQHTAPHCATLQHECNALQRTAMHCNTRNMCCSILLYDAVCCSVKQRVAACSSRRCSQFKVGLFVTLRETLSERHFQRDTPRDKAIPNRAFLQHTATHCNTERMK